MRLPLSGADYFHHLVHRLILRRGGPGNCGQLRVLMTTAPDASAVAAAWRQVGTREWTVGGTYRSGLRGAWFCVRGPVKLTVDHGDSVTRLGDQLFATGLPEGGPRARLGLARGDEPGLVLTWDHRLCDARGAMALLAALPGLGGTGPTGTGLSGNDQAKPIAWLPSKREIAELPPNMAERGTLARGALPHLGRRGRGEIWRPPGAIGNTAAPMVHAAVVLGPEETARVATRQRAVSGRLGETAFLIAALAAALDDLRAPGSADAGDFLFPLALDARGSASDASGKVPGNTSGMLENRHGFVFLRIPAGLARNDLGAAAKVVTAGMRAWLADAAERKLAAALSFFPVVGERLASLEIGGGCAGVAASCLVANTGQTAVPASLFGSTVIGVDHRVAVPAVPGLAVLFHRDTRGLGWDVIASGQVARLVPPAALAERIRHQVVERALSADAKTSPSPAVSTPVSTPASAAVGASP